MLYTVGHEIRTVAQANEMADGVECDDGIRHQEDTGGSGVPVVVRFSRSVVSPPETVVRVARQEAVGRVALSTSQARGIPMASGGQKFSSFRT